MAKQTPWAILPGRHPVLLKYLGFLCRLIVQRRYAATAL